MKKFVSKKVMAVQSERFGNAVLGEITAYEENLRAFLGEIPTLTMTQIEKKASDLMFFKPDILKKSVEKKSEGWTKIKAHIKDSDLKRHYQRSKEDMQRILHKINEASEIVLAISKSLRANEQGSHLTDMITRLSEKSVVKKSLFGGAKSAQPIDDFKASVLPILTTLSMRIISYRANTEIQNLDTLMNTFNTSSLEILDNKKITYIDSVSSKLQGYNFSVELATIKQKYSAIVGNGKVHEGMAFYTEKIKAFEGRLVLLEHMKEAISARRTDSDAASTASSDKSSKLSGLPGKAEFDGYPNKVGLTVLQDLFYEALAKHKPSQAKPSPVSYPLNTGSVRTSQPSALETHKRLQTASMLASSVSNDSGSVSHAASGTVEMLRRLELKVDNPLLKALVPLTEAAQVDMDGLADKISALVDSVDSAKIDELLAIVTHVLTNEAKENTQYGRLCCRILGELLALESTDNIPDGANLSVLERKHIAFQIYYISTGGQRFDNNAAQTTEGKEALFKAGLTESFEVIAAKTPSPVAFSLSSVNFSPSSVIGVPMVGGDLETSLQLRPGSISVSQNGNGSPIISPATASNPMNLRSNSSAFSSRGTNLEFLTVEQLDAKQVSRSGSRSTSTYSNKSVADDLNTSEHSKHDSSRAPSSGSANPESRYASVNDLELNISVHSTHSTGSKKSLVASSDSPAPSASSAPVEAVSERPAGRDIVLNRRASPSMGAASGSESKDDVPVKASGGGIWGSMSGSFSSLGRRMTNFASSTSAAQKTPVVASETEKPQMSFKVQTAIPASTYTISEVYTSDTIKGFRSSLSSTSDAGIGNETQTFIKRLFDDVSNYLISTEMRLDDIGGSLFEKVNGYSYLQEQSLVLLNADTSTNIGAKARVLGVCLLARLAAEGHQVSYHTDQFSDAEKLIFVLQKNATHQKHGKTRQLNASLQECFGIDLALFLETAKKQVPVVEPISRHSSIDLVGNPASVVFEEKRIPEDSFPTVNIPVRKGAAQQIGKKTSGMLLTLYNLAVDNRSTYEDNKELAKTIHSKGCGLTNIRLWIDNLPDKETTNPEDRVRRLIGIRLLGLIGALEGNRDMADPSMMTPAEKVLYEAQIAASLKLLKEDSEESSSAPISAAQKSADSDDLASGGGTGGGSSSKVASPYSISDQNPAQINEDTAGGSSNGKATSVPQNPFLGASVANSSSQVKFTPPKKSLLIQWKGLFVGSKPDYAAAGQMLKGLDEQDHQKVADYLSSLTDPKIGIAVLLKAADVVLVSKILNLMNLESATSTLNALDQSVAANELWLRHLFLKPELHKLFPTSRQLGDSES